MGKISAIYCIKKLTVVTHNFIEGSIALSFLFFDPNDLFGRSCGRFHPKDRLIWQSVGDEEVENVYTNKYLMGII